MSEAARFGKGQSRLSVVLVGSVAVAVVFWRGSDACARLLHPLDDFGDQRQVAARVGEVGQGRPIPHQDVVRHVWACRGSKYRDRQKAADLCNFRSIVAFGNGQAGSGNEELR
ncbi:hypothetical protein LB579_32925, partial [Mesorhizobium sp. BR1-1-7]|uniref:hypothetical protein n=1 Tax=Mesorhizobium sp. BR1-1-7 TaxID=2876647 RepID=UPI001CC96709